MISSTIFIIILALILLVRYYLIYSFIKKEIYLALKMTKLKLNYDNDIFFLSQYISLLVN